MPREGPRSFASTHKARYRITHGDMDDRCDPSWVELNFRLLLRPATFSGYPLLLLFLHPFLLAGTSIDYQIMVVDLSSLLTHPTPAQFIPLD